MKKESVTIISVGGSLIVPRNYVDTVFIWNFRETILKIVNKKNRRFIIVCGGGQIARDYQNVLKGIDPNATDSQLDWIGIQATRLNAQLIASIFGETSDQSVIINPNEKISTNKSIVVAGGWKSGCSTDYVTVLLARNVGARRVINLTNTDGVYDTDPNGENGKKAKMFKNISWNNYLAMIPKKWVPGLSSPFDPVASRKAQEMGLEVVVVNGKNFKNLELCLSSCCFKGTMINNLGYEPNLYPYVDGRKNRRVHRAEDLHIY